MARTATKKPKAKKVSPEVTAAIKTFKATEEVETFYTYILENNLREEASMLMRTVLKSMKPAKKKKKAAQ